MTINILLSDSDLVDRDGCKEVYDQICDLMNFNHFDCSVSVFSPAVEIFYEA